MPTFAPAGRFPSLPNVVRRAVSGRLPLDEIGAEIDRQLDAFTAHRGRLPDFVDGHQHVHALPGVRDRLFAALAARGGTGRVWLRDPADRPAAILRRRVAAEKALVVAMLARGFASAAAAAGFSINHGFSGFSAFDPSRSVARDFARYLVAAGPAHVVMCHPGHVDPGDTLDGVVESRARELAYLASDAFPELLRANGMELARA